MTNPYEPPPPGEQPPPAGGQPPPGQPPYGQPPYGGPPPYGQAPYGQPQYGYGAPPPNYGTNGMAIAALVCSFFCSPLGIIFGFVARSQIRQTGQQGDGLALAGIIIGAVSMVIGIIWLIVVVSAAHSINNNPYGLAPLLLR